MTEQKEAKFLDGLIVKRPREEAPDFIKCTLSFKVDDFIKSLQENGKKSGWVNADMKVSKAGKLYVQINDWQPKTKTEGEQEAPPEPEEIQVENIPF